MDKLFAARNARIVAMNSLLKQLGVFGVSIALETPHQLKTGARCFKVV